MHRILILFCFFLFSTGLLNGQIESFQMTDAVFKGGEKSLTEFIQKNLVYPESARRDKVSGRSVIKFTIDTSGNATHIFVAQSLRGDCDSAAINVCKLLNGWTPATFMGRKVKTSYTLPINFKLNNGKE